MAQFCFAEQRRELFAEAYLRGMLAGWRDFPRIKSHYDAIVAAQGIPGELRSQVCCISDDGAYGELVVSAWCYGYLESERTSEREVTLAALTFREVSDAEALGWMRGSLRGTGEVQAVMNEAYTRFESMPAGQHVCTAHAGDY